MHVNLPVKSGKQATLHPSRFYMSLKTKMRADAAMRIIMLTLLDIMEANEAGVIGNLDNEFLHNFRVAVRRTRTAIAQMESILTPHTLARFAEAFAWLGDITTPVRDLDVQLLKFDKLKTALPLDLRDGLNPFREHLETRQRQEHARLANALQSDAYREAKEQWRRFLGAEWPQHQATVDAARPICDVAGSVIWRMYRRVLRQGRAITTTSPATDLHELRKSCKKLRYLMEFFQSLYPPKKIRRLIRGLKDLQDNLGDFQDLQVQARALALFGEKMSPAEPMPARTRLATDTLLEKLHGSATDVRAEFDSRFERFSRKRNRRQFRKLFRRADKRKKNMTV